MADDDSNKNFRNRPVPLFADPEGAAEMQRLRDLVENAAGDSGWEVSGQDAAANGELLLRFRKKQAP